MSKRKKGNGGGSLERTEGRKEGGKKGDLGKEEKEGGDIWA